jgi:acyl-CoA synthetase (AMP-forming)/AMP-acid ligase II
MIITEILARNARMYGDEIALVEREPAKSLRKQITWKEFDEGANKVANALIAKGIRKGDKVIHLMMNCLEWLPVYFGILRQARGRCPSIFALREKTFDTARRLLKLTPSFSARSSWIESTRSKGT